MKIFEQRNREKNSLRNKMILFFSVLCILFLGALVLDLLALYQNTDNNIMIQPISHDTVGNYISLLGISYSVIFLTTSLLGLLSDKEETIYWSRIAELVLIYPIFLNFSGLSIIGYSTLMVETLAVVFYKTSLFWVSFFLGIISIIVLFFKMIKIYFQRDSFKKQLEQEFVDFNRKARKKQQIETSELKEYREQLENEKLILLAANTVGACENHDIAMMDENIDFLVRLFYKMKNEETADSYVFLFENIYTEIKKVSDIQVIKSITGCLTKSQKTKNDEYPFDLHRDKRYKKDLGKWLITTQDTKNIWLTLDKFRKLASDSAAVYFDQVYNSLENADTNALREYETLLITYITTLDKYGLLSEMYSLIERVVSRTDYLRDEEPYLDPNTLKLCYSNSLISILYAIDNQDFLYHFLSQIEYLLSQTKHLNGNMKTEFLYELIQYMYSKEKIASKVMNMYNQIFMIKNVSNELWLENLRSNIKNKRFENVDKAVRDFEQFWNEREDYYYNGPYYEEYMDESEKKEEKESFDQNTKWIVDSQNIINVLKEASECMKSDEARERYLHLANRMSQTIAEISES